MMKTMNTEYLHMDVLFPLAPLTPYRDVFNLTGRILRELNFWVGPNVYEDVHFGIAFGGLQVDGILEITYEWSEGELQDELQMRFSAIAFEFNQRQPEVARLVVSYEGTYE